MAFFYLIYSSVPCRALSDQELEDLLFSARSANSADDITGALICFKNMYLQLIEGSEPKIRQLYKKLLIDERHYQLHILKEGEIEQRFFPDWSMGFEKTEESADQKLKSFNAFAEKSQALLSILEAG